MVPDIHRAVRYIRHHARALGIDPQRIGIMGASAGGHLSLLLATDGKSGKGGDPVDGASSRVQAVAAGDAQLQTIVSHSGNVRVARGEWMRVNTARR